MPDLCKENVRTIAPLILEPYSYKYDYTGQIDFNFAPFSVYPNECPVTYVCEYDQSFYGTIHNICNFNGAGGQAVFSPDHLSYSFYTNDETAWPAGTYKFKIRGMAGSDISAGHFDAFEVTIWIDRCINAVVEAS